MEKGRLRYKIQQIEEPTHFELNQAYFRKHVAILWLLRPQLFGVSLESWHSFEYRDQPTTKQLLCIFPTHSDYAC